jgi:very-short-patch-repair endonuclease
MKYYSPEEARTRLGNLRYLEDLRLLAKRNRKNFTIAETIVWNQILKHSWTGYKFLRQKSINRFILDFYCSKLLLAIEIDGGIHEKRKNYDKGRDQILESMGIKTLRIGNQEVVDNIVLVSKKIKEEIHAREKLFLSLSSKGDVPTKSGQKDLNLVK